MSVTAVEQFGLAIIPRCERRIVAGDLDQHAARGRLGEGVDGAGVDEAPDAGPPRFVDHVPGPVHVDGAYQVHVERADAHHACHVEDQVGSGEGAGERLLPGHVAADDLDREAGERPTVVARLDQRTNPPAAAQEFPDEHVAQVAGGAGDGDDLGFHRVGEGSRSLGHGWRPALYGK